jgi:hypothetical protein
MQRRTLVALGVAAALASREGVSAAEGAEDLPPPTARKPPRLGFGQRSSFVFSVQDVFGFVSEETTSQQTVSENRTSSLDTKGFFPVAYGPRLGFDGIAKSGLSYGTRFTGWRAANPNADDAGSMLFLELGPRLGWATASNETIGFWLRGGPLFLFLAGSDTSKIAIDATIEGFLVVTPVDHFGLLFGPSIDIPIYGSSSKGSNQTVGRKSVLFGLFTDF